MGKNVYFCKLIDSFQKKDCMTTYDNLENHNQVSVFLLANYKQERTFGKYQRNKQVCKQNI